MRGILETSTFLQPADAMDFVETVLEASTEYSIVGKDPDGTILLWNEGARRLYGYDPEEIVGKVNSDILHTPEDIAAGLPQAMRQAAVADGKWEGTVTRVRRDGSRFTARVVLTPRHNRQGESIGFLLISKDISEEVRLSRELEATQAYTRSLIESNVDALVTTDLLGQITDVNQEMEALTGQRRQELVGSPFKEHFTDPERAGEGIRLALREGKVTNWELTARGSDGRETIVSCNATAFSDRDGTLQGVFAAARDITDRKQAEATLRSSEEQFRGLMEAAPDAMVIVDPDGRITLVNRQTERLFGYQREELLHQPIEILVPERFHGAHVGYRNGYLADPRVREMGAGLQLYGRRKDASEFPVEISLSPLVTDQGTLASAAVRDITERKQAEATLRSSEEQFRGLMEAAPDAMVIVDPDGRITLVNRQTERLFGYQREELLHQPIEILVPERFHARHVGHRNGYLARPGVRPMGAGLQLYGRRKDASEFPVEISLSPLVTDQGTLVSAAVRDITVRKQIEEALQEATLAAEQANEAKSEYLSRMSHELRTPLNAILGFAQVLEMEGLRDDQREGLAHILSGARHLLGLINEVLDIAAIEAGRLSLSLEPVEVADLIAEAVSLIRPLADQQGIVLVDQPQTCDDYVMGDRQRLKQILLNLLSNAVKYNRENGSVQLACEQVAGERMQIKVTDTGTGIAPEVAERLFVPFDRLGSERTSVEGTGLGLPLTKRLAEAMGGALGMASAVGHGSTFWVELPLTEGPVERLQRTEALPEPDRSAWARTALKVLYIEDNLSNLQLVEHILSRRPGIRLISAMRPQLGLELAGEHHPDLVLLDLDLPDMPGEEVLRRLRAEPNTADVPVVILSADARPGLITRLLEQGARAFLTKPLDVKELLALLDTIGAEHEQARSARSRSPNS
jgi:PAS domain S-box-containing protein